MNVAILIATYGDEKWNELALKRAIPSARAEFERYHRPGSICGVGHVHQPDGTLASARNFAAANFITGADWLCFLDADDELEPGYLYAMDDAWMQGVNRVKGARWSPLLVPLVRRVHNGNLASAWAAYPNKGRWPQVNECVIGTLVRRDLFEAVGGFRDTTGDGTPITMYEDWDLWLRCYDAGAGLVYTDAVYREHVNEQGRNTNAHLSQQVYDAIWYDHETRLAAA